ncbi:MAG: phage tail tip lysozyme [Bacteroidota bacterium]
MKATIDSKKTSSKKNNTSSFIARKGTNKSLFIQAKLAVGQSNDKYEKEADAMAEKIVTKSKTPRFISPTNNALPTKNNAASNSIQRKTEKEKEEEISEVQLKPSNTTQTPSSSFESKLKTSQGSGNPMTTPVKTEMEAGFGRNFSNVRIHTGSNAIQMSKDMGAKAFTNGNNIYFNSNRYNPNSASGKRLLAHELTHVVQQKSNSTVIQKDGDPAAATPATTTATPTTTSSPNTAETQATVDAFRTLGGQLVMTSSMLSTKVGPPSQNQDIFLIIGPTTKISNIGSVLLPLWNTATPFTSAGSTTPNITTPLTADELAKGLFVFNRYQLAIPPAANPPTMTNWKIGMRFPLPIRIDHGTTEGVLHPLIIRSMAGGFDTAWNDLLDELPQLIENTTPADLTQQTQDFITTNSRFLGLALMARATQNAVANEQLILEVFRQSGTNAFNVALDFMWNAVNRDISLLQGQESGARILGAISAILNAPHTALDATLQSKLDRAQHMLGLVSSVEPERLTQWEAITRDERSVYVMRVLIDNYNFPINGAAGLVGNLYSESGILPNRVEGNRDLSNPMRARDNRGRMTDFTPEQIMNRVYRRSGPRLPGIGLAQWTSANRREGLFQHSFRGRQDGADIVYNMEAQIDYLVTELQGSYRRVYNVITANDVSVHDASDEVIYNFEIPGSILSGGKKLPRSNAQVQRAFGHRRSNGDRALRAYNESQGNTED